MKEPTYVITYDVGTTGVKTCLFEIGEVVRLTAAAMRGPPYLYSVTAKH